MNRLSSNAMKQLSQIDSEQPTPSSTNKKGDDDDTFTKNENDDQQAHIRRRAPTRHSIKSLSGRKTLTRQTSSTEVKSFFFFRLFIIIALPHISSCF